jgi:hypothetical protein
MATLVAPARLHAQIVPWIDGTLDEIGNENLSVFSAFPAKEYVSSGMPAASRIG